MAELKVEMGDFFKATDAMSIIARKWRQMRGVASPVGRRSPKSRKSAGCNPDWAEKCAAKDRLCHVGSSGRRSCVKTPEQKKAAANLAAKKRRAALKAGASPKPRGRPAKKRASF